MRSLAQALSRNLSSPGFPQFLSLDNPSPPPFLVVAWSCQALRLARGQGRRGPVAANGRRPGVRRHRAPLQPALPGLSHRSLPCSRSRPPPPRPHRVVLCAARPAHPLVVWADVRLRRRISTSTAGRAVPGGLATKRTTSRPAASRPALVVQGGVPTRPPDPFRRLLVVSACPLIRLVEGSSFTSQRSRT